MNLAGIAQALGNSFQGAQDWQQQQLREAIARAQLADMQSNSAYQQQVRPLELQRMQMQQDALRAAAQRSAGADWAAVHPIQMGHAPQVPTPPMPGQASMPSTGAQPAPQGAAPPSIGAQPAPQGMAAPSALPREPASVQDQRDVYAEYMRMVAKQHPDWTEAQLAGAGNAAAATLQAASKQEMEIIKQQIKWADAQLLQQYRQQQLQNSGLRARAAQTSAEASMMRAKSGAGRGGRGAGGGAFTDSKVAGWLRDNSPRMASDFLTLQDKARSLRSQINTASRINIAAVPALQAQLDRVSQGLNELRQYVGNQMAGPDDAAAE